MNKFECSYHLRSYECDQNGFLRLVTLLNLLQDMADTHAQNLGFGLDFCLKNGLAWFGANYHIQIDRLPKVHENIRIQTWPSLKKKFGAVRDFVVLDQNDVPIIRASSFWILIDFVRKKPVMIDTFIQNYEPFEERAVVTDFPKAEQLERIDETRDFCVRYDDIDFNGHVNNAVYLLWAAESTDCQFRLAHIPEEIEIAYKKECVLGDVVKVDMWQKNKQETLAAVCSADDHILAQARIRWRTI